MIRFSDAFDLARVAFFHHDLGAEVYEPIQYPASSNREIHSRSKQEGYRIVTQRRGDLGAASGRNQINELDVLWHGLPTVPRWRIKIHPELAAKVGRSGDRPTTCLHQLCELRVSASLRLCVNSNAWDVGPPPCCGLVSRPAVVGWSPDQPTHQQR